MGRSIIAGATSKKKAKKRAMSFVKTISPGEKKQYKDLFDSVDEDKSGSLEHKEVIGLLKKTALYTSDKQAKAVIKMYDIDESGGLEFHEFIAMLEAWKSLSELNKNKGSASGELTAEDIAQYKEIFTKIDKDNSGSISTKELAESLKTLDLFDNSKQAEGIILFFDMDENGEMTFNEFLTAICAASAMKDLRDEAAEAEAARVAAEKRTCFSFFSSIMK